MTPEKIATAAKLLADAYNRHDQLPEIPADCSPQEREDSYAIQDAMAENLGLTCAGWKLGMSAPGTMRQFGVTAPVPGRIFKECIFDDGASVRAGHFSAPKVEPEFAARLKNDLPPRDAEYTYAEVAAATGAILLCFEIADNRVAMATPQPLAMIADNGGFAAYVVGPEVANWRDVDFAAAPVDLIIDGEVAAPGLTGEFRIDPIDVVVWTINDLSRRGYGMAAGDLISTGSATVPTAMGIGSEAIGKFEGLGEVRVKFTP
ncbi:MAG: hypothetical protein HN403_08670 [Rhodospirillales bacterium]|jgi:2-keto-4-pentenoate hydratase|nr:hypothetical protein [Rhodospirillales bacterium]